MLIPLNITIQDDYCKKCKALYISTVKSDCMYKEQIKELINYLENNELTQSTIDYYTNLGLTLEDIQYDGSITAYTIAKLALDLLNLLDPSGMYQFHCLENSKHCEGVGYSCFYRGD